MNMIKVMWWRFEQCLGMFTMFIVEGSSEMEPFRHLSIQIFLVPNLGNTKPMKVIFFSKMFKIWDKFKKCSKK